MRVLVAIAVLLASTAAAGERQTFVVSAAAPLDAERLAEVLRVYLDEFDVDVRTAPAPPPSELRDELGATRALGEEVRALATVRIGANAGSVEILFVDHFAHKALVATIQRPPRDEDFYRVLALKIQGLLRSALYEHADEVAAKAPALARLVTPPIAPTTIVQTAPSSRHRLALEVAYALDTFPEGKLVQQGVAVRARFELRRIWELGVGVDALAPLQQSRGDVTAQLATVPIVVDGGLHLRHRRLEGSLDAVAELLVLDLGATSATTPVRGDVRVTPAFGGELGGRVRLAQPLWLYLRGACLGVVAGERDTIRGVSVFDWSRLQVSAQVGLAVAVW